MLNNLEIRQATKEDIPDITRIYNYAIENTTSTFDMEPKTLEDRYEWFSAHSDDFPLIVATISDIVVGWASIHPFGERSAYRYTVEDAIYIDCEYQGRGLGNILLNELIEIAKKKEVHIILALIVGGNDASIKLHEKFGFELVGVMKEAGRKFDRWLDVLIYEKMLNYTM